MEARASAYLLTTPNYHLWHDCYMKSTSWELHREWKTGEQDQCQLGASRAVLETGTKQVNTWAGMRDWEKVCMGH